MRIYSFFIFTMWEMSSRHVNSLKLMVRCRRAVRREISFILLRLLPWRFNTWKFDMTKIIHCEHMKWSANEADHWVLTVIWLRTLALATLRRILSSKLNNVGCGFSTGSMLRASLSRIISLEEISCLPGLWPTNAGCSSSYNNISKGLSMWIASTQNYCLVVVVAAGAET